MKHRDSHLDWRIKAGSHSLWTTRIRHLSRSPDRISGADWRVSGCDAAGHAEAFAASCHGSHADDENLLDSHRSHLIRKLAAEDPVVIPRGARMTRNLAL